MAAVGMALVPARGTWLCTQECPSAILLHPVAGCVLEFHEASVGWFRIGQLGVRTSMRVLSNGNTELQPWSGFAKACMWGLAKNQHLSQLMVGGELVNKMWKIQYHALDGEECVTVYHTGGNGVDRLVLQLGTDSIKHYRKDGQPSGSEVNDRFNGTPPGDVLLSLVVEGGTCIDAGSNWTPHGGAVVACYSLGGAMVSWSVGQSVRKMVGWLVAWSGLDGTCSFL